jgi:hypothetical protein
MSRCRGRRTAVGLSGGHERTMRGCGDPDFEWAMYTKRFCESKKLSLEGLRLIIQEYTGAVITYDCHIVQAEEFRVGKQG